MTIFLDDDLQLQPQKHYYRTIDICEKTGLTPTELRAEMVLGRFPRHHLVQLCFWEKKLVDDYLKKHNKN